MRWFLRSLAALAFLWVCFAASPYLALYDLARAIDRGDAEQVAQRVNFRALRVSLAKELIEGYLIETEADADGRISPSERQAAISAVALFGDALLAPIVTPQGLIELMRMPVPTAEPESEPPKGFRARSWGDFVRLVASSQTRGFRNISFGLPPRAGPEARFRVHFRLTRFEWRVVRLELPPEIRRRLARQIAAQGSAEVKR